jgi:hypothetical protein
LAVNSHNLHLSLELVDYVRLQFLLPLHGTAKLPSAGHLMKIVHVYELDDYGSSDYYNPLWADDFSD